MMYRTKLLALSFFSASAIAQPTFDLSQLENMAMQSNRAVMAARDQVASARSAVDTASAFPNPEIEVLRGSTRSITPGGNPGTARSTTITQPIDMPWERSPRIAAAEAGFNATSAVVRGFEADTLARLRSRFFELLKREAELRNTLEDKELMEKVRSRIEMRVNSGESARFELIKADAETLIVQKVAQANALRVEQSRSLLRQTVGSTLPENFQITGNLRQVPDLTPIESLRTEVDGNNPEVQRARSELVRAEQKLTLERNKRLPTVALKASRDDDPDMRSTKFGVVLSIPLWDQRKGPVGEATAQVSRARNELEASSFSLRQTLEVAYQQYEVAKMQVTALESGIVLKAQAALKVAEAAYRFGERSFLEVLDAQRVYRATRAELIAARYELASAWIEIERLRANTGVKPE